MVKKIVKKKVIKKKVIKKKPKKHVRRKSISKKTKKISEKDIPTLKLKTEQDIAMDFAVKAYKKFDKLLKSIILFGSTTKGGKVVGSDIDIILLLDDASVKWDQELIAWYREELEKIISANPYKHNLHVNTIKLTSWWEDLMRGDPLILNILRDGEAMIDAGGFFNPLKHLLIEGKIKSTPEAIYTCLQRAPIHIARSKAAGLSVIEGLFWSMVDSSHAALIAANIRPSSPEHIPRELNLAFVDHGKLKSKYLGWYKDLLILHKEINHGNVRDLKGVEVDAWQTKAEEFLNVMAKLVKELVD